jgi:hypothetical protein
LLPSNNQRSFRVYALTNSGKVYVGSVSRKALSALLQNIIPQADICQYAETLDQAAIKESLNFSLEL